MREQYDRGHHAGATVEERIRNRLKNSGGDGADHIVKGDGKVRFTNLHSSANHVRPRDVREDKA